MSWTSARAKRFCSSREKCGRRKCARPVADRGEVVVGIDLLRHVGAVLDYAFETAALRDARLRVVHARQTFGTLIEAGYAVHGEQSELDLRAEVVQTCKPLRAMRGDAITGRA